MNETARLHCASHECLIKCWESVLAGGLF